jgi:hypothetical protein
MDEPAELGTMVMNRVSKSLRPQGDLERSLGDGHAKNKGGSTVEDVERKHRQNSEREVRGSGEAPPEDLSPAEKNLRMLEA